LKYKKEKEEDEKSNLNAERLKSEKE